MIGFGSSSALRFSQGSGSACCCMIAIATVDQIGASGCLRLIVVAGARVLLLLLLLQLWWWLWWWWWKWWTINDYSGIGGSGDFNGSIGGILVVCRSWFVFYARWSIDGATYDGRCFRMIILGKVNLFRRPHWRCAVGAAIVFFSRRRTHTHTHRVVSFVFGIHVILRVVTCGWFFFELKR